MSETRKANRFIQLNVFRNEVQDEDAVEEEINDIEDSDIKRELRPDGSRRPSAYVIVFEEMVNEVLRTERRLLSAKELDALGAFSNLCYNSRYCLIRMVLRKEGQWNPLTSFEKWKVEVGPEGLLPSILPLCQSIKGLLSSPTPSAQCPPVKKEEAEETPLPPSLIDLTESDDEDVKPKLEAHEPPIPRPLNPSREPLIEDPIERIIKKPSNTDDLILDCFCESDENMTLAELLDRMKVEQLKNLAKQNKCKPSKKALNKSDYINALLSNASSQRVLNFKQDIKGKGKAIDSLRQTQLPFAMSRDNCRPSQERRLRAQVLKVLEHPPSLMLPALLTRFKKRSYALYKHERDEGIWPSRLALVDYEEAMELEMLLDTLIESKLEEQRAGTAKLKQSATPGVKQTLRTPKIAKIAAIDPVPHDDPCYFDPENVDVEKELPPEDPKIQTARKVVQYLDEWILYRWNLQLEIKRERNADRTPALQRFEPGYIYSRMLRKALKALATLGEFERELEIVGTILSQRLFLRGKRAKLYERRAIIQTAHLHRQAYAPATKTAILREALEGVREALLDEDTILVSRPSLLRRLRRLEKQLKVPAEECAICEGELRKAGEVEFRARRIFHRDSSLKLDAMGVPIKNKENGINSYLIPTANGKSPSKPSANPALNLNSGWRKRTGKSIWAGRNSEEVSVEQRALEDYEDLGFKGFHAETSILTTIFGLLFWDIIFADVRGAFETAFQSAPLDIVDDSFYYARRKEIDDRLEALREGDAVEILSKHYDEHHEKKTMCIGVRWDICSKQDLVEILECLGGKQIASVCKLFCEDYTGRCSGAPDLIAWNTEHRICKFVEVKGPGDTPQENQKLWFDSLLAAGIDVEICKVVDENDVKRMTTAGRGRTSAAPSTRKRRRAARKSCSDSDMEEEDYDKLDPESVDEVPQLSRPSHKRRRATDPGPLAGHQDPP